MKIEGCEGWLCYIPVTSPFPSLNTKLHSQTLSIYILPLSARSTLTHIDTGKGVPSHPAHKITNGFSKLTYTGNNETQISKCLSGQISTKPLDRTFAVWESHIWLKQTIRIQNM